MVARLYEVGERTHAPPSAPLYENAQPRGPRGLENSTPPHISAATATGRRGVGGTGDADRRRSGERPAETLAGCGENGGQRSAASAQPRELQGSPPRTPSHKDAPPREPPGSPPRSSKGAHPAPSPLAKGEHPREQRPSEGTRAAQPSEPTGSPPRKPHERSPPREGAPPRTPQAPPPRSDAGEQGAPLVPSLPLETLADLRRAVALEFEWAAEWAAEEGAHSAQPSELAGSPPRTPQAPPPRSNAGAQGAPGDANGAATLAASVGGAAEEGTHAAQPSELAGSPPRTQHERSPPREGSPPRTPQAPPPRSNAGEQGAPGDANGAAALAASVGGAAEECATPLATTANAPSLAQLSPPPGNADAAAAPAASREAEAEAARTREAEAELHRVVEQRRRAAVVLARNARRGAEDRARRREKRLAAARAKEARTRTIAEAAADAWRAARRGVEALEAEHGGRPQPLSAETPPALPISPEAHQPLSTAADACEATLQLRALLGITPAPAASPDPSSEALGLSGPVPQHMQFGRRGRRSSPPRAGAPAGTAAAQQRGRSGSPPRDDKPTATAAAQQRGRESSLPREGTPPTTATAQQRGRSRSLPRDGTLAETATAQQRGRKGPPRRYSMRQGGPGGTPPHQSQRKHARSPQHAASQQREHRGSPPCKGPPAGRGRRTARNRAAHARRNARVGRATVQC